VVTLALAAAILIVNLSYPEWTGGWSTGPRLLVPLLPFAMVPVAAILAGRGRLAEFAAGAASILALGGAVLMFLIQGVGARIPQDVEAPLRTIVWPLWNGATLPHWWTGQRFTATVAALWSTDWQKALQLPRHASQFLPLAGIQLLSALAIFWGVDSRGNPPSGSLHLSIDEQEHGRCTDQNAQNPQREPRGVAPNPRP
jgi:hypothetical protein